MVVIVNRNSKLIFSKFQSKPSLLIGVGNFNKPNIVSLVDGWLTYEAVVFESQRFPQNCWLSYLFRLDGWYLYPACNHIVLSSSSIHPTTTCLFFFSLSFLFAFWFWFWFWFLALVFTCFLKLKIKKETTTCSLLSGPRLFRAQLHTIGRFESGAIWINFSTFSLIQCSNFLESTEVVTDFSNTRITRFLNWDFEFNWNGTVPRMILNELNSDRRNYKHLVLSDLIFKPHHHFILFYLPRDFLGKGSLALSENMIESRYMESWEEDVEREIDRGRDEIKRKENQEVWTGLLKVWRTMTR